MEIKKLQEEIDRINILVSDYYKSEFDEKKILKMTLKLGEEYGELCEAILSSEGHQRKEKIEKHSFEDVKGELADVIITAMTIARYLDVDLEEIITKKLKIIEERLVD